MGKSAKFYKRPTKKEKESIAIKKLVEPSAISKKETKKISVPASMFQQKDKKKVAPVPAASADGDIDMTAEEKPVEKKKEKKEKKEKEGELPDYIDLFSGKKTYKKIPVKRK